MSPYNLITGTTLLIACFSLPSVAMDIVRDGDAVATVVVHEHSGPLKQVRGRPDMSADAWAARVLVEWIKKITGVALPVSNRVPAGKPVIYVGKAAIEKGLKLDDIESGAPEGLRIVSDDRRALFAGRDDVSTVKAACRFLEELGCRYFMDHPLGEVYPRKKTISVGSLDIIERPGLHHRRIWGSRWGGDTPWKIWNGAGGSELAIGHAWGNYVSQDLFDEHPEYFALRDGRRRRGDWYCTSNPGLRKAFIQGVLASIKAGNLHPSLSPPDGTGYCECKVCRAQDDPASIAPSSGRISMTNRYVDFYNAVAREVSKVSPESILSFYCYADYTQPPTRGIRLEPNLCAWLTPIRYCRFHRIGHPACSSRSQLEKVFDGWPRRPRNWDTGPTISTWPNVSFLIRKFPSGSMIFPISSGKAVSASAWKR